MNHTISNMAASRAFTLTPPGVRSLHNPPVKEKNEASAKHQHPRKNFFQQGMALLGDTFTDARNEVVKRFCGARDLFDTAKDRVAETYSNARDAIGTAIENRLGLTSKRDLIDGQLEQLNSDGDSAVIQLRAQVDASANLTPLGIPITAGVSGQYGYRVDVTQNGGELPAGAEGETLPAKYEVNFDKRLLTGINAKDPSIPGYDLKAGVSLGTADRVTMTFDTKDEAARAVELLGRVASSETMRDLGDAVPIGPPNPMVNAAKLYDTPGNPLIAQEGGYNAASLIDSVLPKNPVEAMLDFGADAVAPNEAEMAFLTDHISGYTTKLDAMAGAAFAAKLPAGFAELNSEIGLNGIAGVTRTVELPNDGAPGQVTYALALKGNVKSKTGGALGLSVGDTIKANAGIKNRMDHLTFTREVKMSWNFDENQMGPTVNGVPYPVVGAALEGEFRAPDNLTVKLDTGAKNQPDWDISRADFLNTSVEFSVDQPGKTAGSAIQAALDGDIKQAKDIMGDNATLTLASRYTKRSGFENQPYANLKIADTGIGASLIREVGVDDITRLDKLVLGGQQPHQAVDQGLSPSPEKVDPPHQEAEPSDQVVVRPREGLTLRDAPNGQRDSVFFNGTFLDPTGNHQTDADGQSWTEVNGLDVNDNPVSGWVPDAHITRHPEGAMNHEARINPELEAMGYRAHRVEAGENVWDIAARNGCDFQETLALNTQHLVNPELIFEGDVVYLPVANGQ